METILKLAALFTTLFTALIYLGWTLSKYPIQKSISETYNLIEQKIFFSLFIWWTVAPLLVFGFDPVKPLFIISIALVGLVGVFPMIKKPTVFTLHMIVAISGIVLAMVSMVIEFGCWVPVGLYAILCIAAVSSVRKYCIYIIEVLAIICIWFILAFDVY